MKHNKNVSEDRKRRYAGIRQMVALTLAVLLVVLLAGQTGMAQYDERVRPSAGNETETILDDGGTPEVGIEWITDWPGTADDRANWYHSANGLYKEMGGAGWIRRFFWGNTNSWERDFKRAALGGIEQSMYDAVDLGFIGTHGSGAYDNFWGRNLSSVYFSSNNDDWHLSPGEAYRSLGDNDLEWIAFDSCSVLRDDSMAYWASTFDGLHLMAGFANTMYVVYPGDGGEWGNQMRTKGWWIFKRGAKTVTQAWFTATDDQQPHNVRARVLAEVLDNYNDYIWGEGYVSPDPPVNGTFWYWDHVSGTPQPLPLQDVPGELPILKLETPEVNEKYVKNIGEAFGLTSEILRAPDGSAYYMVGGEEDERQVRVDALSGGYYYQNLGQLWTDPERQRNLPEDPDQVYDLTLGFLAQHDNLPGVFDFDQSIPPTIELESVIEMATADKSVQRELDANALNYAVGFMRTADLGEFKLSIVGPGSRQNVYMGDNGEVIGLKGGWRPVMFEERREMVPIIDPDQAWEMFLDNPAIAVAQTPKADEYQLSEEIAPTLAYYEQSSLQGQQELIPVWVFTANLHVEAPDAERETTELLPLAFDVNIYIPASGTSNAVPAAKISSPVGDEVLKVGETVNLKGSADGGVKPYSFSWSSSVDGSLGDGTLVAGVTLSPDLRSASLNPNRVTLTVRDANGLTATAAVDVIVLPANYLPITIK